MTNSPQVSEQKVEIKPPWSHTLKWISLLTYLVSMIWLITQPSFEPLLGFLIALATYLSSSSVVSPSKVKKVQETNREILLDKVRQFWIEGVLNPALHDNIFPLGMELKPKAVLKPFDHEEHALPTTDQILDAMADVGRALLILGAPGAGKTVLLLQVAEKLIERAQNESKKPIPIVLNLSSWAEKKSTLQDWMVERLFLEYQVPRKVGKRWIDNEQLLPLLDGLDEVKEDIRNACVEAINTFRKHYKSVNPVICSRIADYELLKNLLDLHNAVLVLPLTDDDVAQHLIALDFTALRKMMHREPHTKEMAKTPFLLNIMTSTYRGSTPVDLSRSNTEKERLDHLLSNYLKLRFDHKPQDIYTLAQMKIWLTWLSTILAQYNRTVFYIEELQPEWLRKPQQNYYQLIFGFLGGLIGVLVLGLMGVFAEGLGTGLLFAVFGLIAGLLYGIAALKINPAEILRWSWSPQVSNAVIPGMISAISGGLSGWLATREISGLISGMATGLGLVVVVGMSSGLETTGVSSKRIIPNRGIYLSARNTILAGILNGLSFGMLIFFMRLTANRMIGKETQELLIWLSWGLVSGLLFSCVSILKHPILRLFLWRLNYAPLNYARFLDYCASMGIMRKVGGGYIFQHRILLEYFASLSDENKSPTS